MMISILIICVFFAYVDYARKETANFYVPNFILIIMGMCLLLLFYEAAKLVTKHSPSKSNNIIFKLLGFSLMFLLIQVFSVYNYYFKTDWDVITIVDCAILVANDQPLDVYMDYLSMYPNNMLLVYLFSRITKIAFFLGLESQAYFILLIFQCCIYWITGLMIFHIITYLTSKYPLAFGGYFIYLLLVGLSPWVSIPYSDSVGLFYPTCIYWVYTRMSERKFINFLRWFAIAFLSYIGYKIKPQVIIITIAIVIIHSFHAIWYRRISWNILAFISGVLCSFLLVSNMLGNLQVTIDKEKEFGLTHFLMMGMNTNAMGVWAAEDVEYSKSFLSSSERSEMNIQLTKERLKEMGAGGLFQHFCRKTLTNYNDGTFCWGGEGDFYYELIEEKSQIVSPILRNIYYNRDCQGKYYPIWSHFEQMVWMCTLLLSVFSIRSKGTPKESILMLSIIGLTLFQLLFEARARYLFIYTPIYIILAILGIHNIQNMYTKKFN